MKGITQTAVHTPPVHALQLQSTHQNMQQLVLYYVRLTTGERVLNFTSLDIDTSDRALEIPKLQLKFCRELISGKYGVSYQFITQCLVIYHTLLQWEIFVRYIFCDQYNPLSKYLWMLQILYPIHEPFRDGNLAYSPVSEHPWIMDTTLTISICGHPRMGALPTLFCQCIHGCHSCYTHSWTIH